VIPHVVLRKKVLAAAKVAFPDLRVKVGLMLNPVVPACKRLIGRHAFRVKADIRLKISEDMSPGIEVSDLAT
jgi:hypothetical protein